jgi:hypothetical protein
MGDFYAKSAILTCRVLFYTQSVIFTQTNVILTFMRVNITLTSVITIRSSLIYARRVWFPHTVRDFHMQSVISTRRV